MKALIRWVLVKVAFLFDQHGYRHDGTTTDVHLRENCIASDIAFIVWTASPKAYVLNPTLYPASTIHFILSQRRSAGVHHNPVPCGRTVLQLVLIVLL